MRSRINDKPPLPGRRFLTPLSSAPAFFLFAATAVYLVLLDDYSFPAPLAISISILALTGWGIIGTTWPNKSSAPVVALLIGAMICSAVFLTWRLERDHRDQVYPRSVQGRGTVILSRIWGYRSVALVRSNAGTYVVRLKREDGDRISTGDIVFFSGSFVPFERANAPGGFDELRYWRPKGAIGAVEAESIEKEGRSAGPAAWRDFLNKKISSSLPPRTAGYVMASWTGERDEFLTDLHRLDGTSHLLAVSGFHVGIVFGICWFFLRRFRSRLYPISAAIWAYVLLTGAAPSSVRAAAMIQVMIVGRLVGRSGKSFNTACVAGFIMLIVNPWLMWDIGWRLSVLAVLAITAVAQANCVKWKVFIAPPLVWLATSMQAAWTFGDVPIAGLVTNLIALPAFGVLFPLAWILSLPALIGLPFGDLPARFAEFLFARWETLSGNIIFLLPQQISFSASLVISGSFALTYFFALASGFSGNRAMLAAVIHLAGLLWVSW